MELFNKNEITIPSEDDTELGVYEKKYDIDKLILGSKVKTLAINEDTDIKLPNIVINLENTNGVMNNMQKEAIRSIINQNGEYNLYIYSKKIGLVRLGCALIENIYSINFIKEKCFGDEIEIYLNMEKDSTELKTINSNSLGKMRLKI